MKKCLHLFKFPFHLVLVLKNACINNIFHILSFFFATLLYRICFNNARAYTLTSWLLSHLTQFRLFYINLKTFFLNKCLFQYR